VGRRTRDLLRPRIVLFGCGVVLQILRELQTSYRQNETPPLPSRPRTLSSPAGFAGDRGGRGIGPLACDSWHCTDRPLSYLQSDSPLHASPRRGWVGGTDHLYSLQQAPLCLWRLDIPVTEMTTRDGRATVNQNYSSASSCSTSEKWSTRPK
jgi:hypothetical protein